MPRRPLRRPGVLAAAVTIDKLICKRLLAERGIPQVDFCEVGEDGWREHAAGHGPAASGSSPRGWARASASPRSPSPERSSTRPSSRPPTHDPRVIIEAHGGGREVECSVIGNDEPETSLPGEIVAHADWYDYAAKYERGRHGAGRPRADRRRRPSRASASSPPRSSRRCGCSGLARCDFFVTDDGEVLVNEINTIPGFTETSVFAKLFEASGVAYTELCDRLVQLALERHERERSFEY